MDGDSATMGNSPSSSTDAVVQQKIEDQITCPVCFEIYREPKALPCYHVFCLLCLKKVAEKVKPGDDLCCPQCRKPLEIPEEGLSALQSAFHINSLIEIYEAIQKNKTSPKDAPTSSACANCPGSKAGYFCPKCSHFLCEDCRVIHGKWPKYSQHVLSPLSESENKSPDFKLLCDLHPTHPLTHYCQECKLLMCRECLLRSDLCTHAQSTLSVTEATHQCKDSILATLEPIRRQLGTVEGAIERIRAKKKHIAEQAADVKSCIDEDFTGLLRALEQRQGKLKEVVEREEEGKLLGLQSQEDKAEVARAQLSNYLEGINHCLQKGSSQQVIGMQQAVEEKVKMIMQEFHLLPLSPVEEANLHFFSSKEVSATLTSFGSVYSSGVTAGNCSVSGEGLHWATACLETSVTVTHNGDSKQGNWYSYIDTKLSSEDNSNTLVVTRRDVYGLKKQVVIHYVPITKGKKKLHVTLCGKEVSNSPFNLRVMAPFHFTGMCVWSVSGLRRPWGITVTPAGQLVVVDNQGWDGLHLYEANGSKVRSFAPAAIVPGIMYHVPGIILPDGQCFEPRGVAIGKDGNLLLVDGKGHRIQRFSPDGVSYYVVGSSGKRPLQFNDPVGITVSHSGEVLVCDRRNHRIQVLTPDLSFTRQIGQFGVDERLNTDLYLPWDVACDSEGQIYVADCGHCCVKVFTNDGQYVRKIGSEGTGRGQFKYLSSICIDCNDYLYALDKERACVSIFNPQGELKMQFGTPGQLEGQFCEPLGIAVDREGQVYVSDGHSLSVQFQSLGRVQVFR